VFRSEGVRVIRTPVGAESEGTCGALGGQPATRMP
jgi:hypothetical protein